MYDVIQQDVHQLSFPLLVIFPAKSLEFKVIKIEYQRRRKDTSIYVKSSTFIHIYLHLSLIHISLQLSLIHIYLYLFLTPIYLYLSLTLIYLYLPLIHTYLHLFLIHIDLYLSLIHTYLHLPPIHIYLHLSLIHIYIYLPSTSTYIYPSFISFLQIYLVLAGVETRGPLHTTAPINYFPVHIYKSLALCICRLLS